MSELFLRKFVVGPLDTNVYVVTNVMGEGILIDAGPGALERILYLVDRGLVHLKYVLLTHGHFDHVSDAEFIKEATGAKVIMHTADKEILQYSESLSKYYRIKWKDPELDIHLSGDDALTLCSIKVLVIHTPGHTPGSVCYYLPEKGWLFTGDTLFKGTVGRTDFPGGSNIKMQESLSKLAKLPNNTIVHPGHGPSSTILQERTQNPFMSEINRS